MRPLDKLFQALFLALRKNMQAAVGLIFRLRYLHVEQKARIVFILACYR